ncbi:DUF4097 family beta strand repeat-containing protein [Kitasatospora acidiphila]|nr:DUF4097 family beta strand repeat-containing protein [Kitasatospora acidiphila]
MGVSAIVAAIACGIASLVSPAAVGGEHRVIEIVEILFKVGSAMQHRLRYLGALAIAGAALSVLTAYDLGLGPHHELHDDAAVSGQITAVRLDSGSGSVTLNGQAGATTVSVHRDVDYQGGRPTAPTTQVDNGVLVLHGCGQHCSVSYTVALPAGLPVGGQTSNGEISLSQVGNVQVSTSNGSITLNGVNGTVDAHSSNGTITGRGLNGTRVQAQTSNGEIDLAPSKAQDVHASTDNGAITVVAPAASYKVSSQSDSGGTNISVPNDPSGQFLIDLRTGNGQIAVKSA